MYCSDLTTREFDLVPEVLQQAAGLAEQLGPQLAHRGLGRLTAGEQLRQRLQPFRDLVMEDNYKLTADGWRTAGKAFPAIQ